MRIAIYDSSSNHLGIHDAPAAPNPGHTLMLGSHPWIVTGVEHWLHRPDPFVSVTVTHPEDVKPERKSHSSGWPSAAVLITVVVCALLAKVLG